ncbi:arginyl-tRNA synthetase [Alkalihalobacillus xiaoxiensis]|uniref:arginine--tRNA ligase n=1 Tax=Shouchella xiaoxiensis TaxID=766895 RepID=A0ABS2STN1_9BACI|nr:arginine--tRNA ligase [Shouchella xiaoxiensis]MBM7837627.1 arginyl-tRNA synthetase [Shouchella xiaoxiensis]
MQLEQQLSKAIQDAAGTYSDQIQIELEQPAQLIHGDYSTNVAMKLARVAKKNPFEIAMDLKAQLERKELPINQVDVVRPGFINFFIDWDQIQLNEATVNEWATNPRKVVVEHTSINPNKSAHIGHLRNACIGDTLVRIHQLAGSEVEVHNYIDDLGNQLADTVTALLHTESSKPAARFGDYCWEIYSSLNQAYEANELSTDVRDDILHKLEAGNNSIAWLGYAVADKLASEHIEEMGQFGIDYDLLVWERDIVGKGFWEEAFEKLKQTDVFFKQESGPQAGCWVIRTGEDVEDDLEESAHLADKILVRSNGVLTYTAKDIAYHMWKFGLLERNFLYKPKTNELWTTNADGIEAEFGQADAVINVIDYRQEYPQKVVKQALFAAGYEEQANQLHHVPYGVVSLSKQTAKRLGLEVQADKDVYAMSGRKGIGIKINDLITEMKQAVRVQSPQANEQTVETLTFAAIRYNMLRYNTTSDIVFDLDEATQVTGNTGIYLVYTYARANSIAEKAEGANISADGASFARAADSERALLKHLSGWTTTFQKAVHTLEPNLICTFAFELASLYNRFYSQCPVLKANEDEQKRRVLLTQLVIQKLEDVFAILGLPSQKKI